MSTIAAIATPLALGGVSMIRISGSGAFSIAERVFSPISGEKLSDKAGYTACYGNFVGSTGETVDDGIALVFHAPHSYTGEDVVELSCHGGVCITREILRLVLDAGASLAESGEFSKRAFLNGKMSLTQAEGVIDLIHSKSMQAARSAHSQMDGALYRRISGMKEALLAIAGHLSAWADYPEEDLEEVESSDLLGQLSALQRESKKLLATFDSGKLLREGVETVLVGKPNVGKSTLMNLLSGAEKSIVTSIAGTTRDVVEETVQLGDVLLRLADTAGIHETDDVVEQVGVKRAIDRIETAGLVLAVFDYSLPLSEEDKQLTEVLEKQEVPVLALLHKTDLAGQMDEEYLRAHYPNLVMTSKDDPESLTRIEEAVTRLLHLTGFDPSQGILANERQRGCAVLADRAIGEAVDALQAGMTLDAVDLSVEEALDALLTLTGERVTEAVVDQVFHNFCVGK